MINIKTCGKKKKKRIKIGEENVNRSHSGSVLTASPSLSTYTATVSFSDLCLFRSDSDLHNDSTFIGFAGRRNRAPDREIDLI